MDIHQQLIEQNVVIQIATAGAGPQLISELWKQPGSSAYLAGATLLQARHEMQSYIGFTPDHGYCSPETAIDMAFTAYIRAVKSSVTEHEEKAPIGIAITAAVASNRIPKGDQRAHIAIITANGVFTEQLLLEKSEGTAARATHDNKITEHIKSLLLKILATPEQSLNQAAFDRLEQRPKFLGDGRRHQSIPTQGAYFPANFNPIHDGHRHACKEAERQTGQKVHFMIEACPPHKDPIPIPEILRRIANLQLEESHRQDPTRTIIVTIGEPNYLDKARLRPSSQFIAGADAIIRILQPGWGYQVSDMLEEFQTLDIKFHVLGREVEGKYTSIHDIDIPETSRNLFIHLDGHHNISSTELRNAAKKV